MDKLLLTPEEAAEVLGIGRTRVFRLMATGELRSLLIGRSRRIPADALPEFVAVLEAVAGMPDRGSREDGYGFPLASGASSPDARDV